VPEVKIVPATAEDVTPFFSGAPPYRMRAFAGKRGDTVLGVGGLYFLPDGARAAFLVVSDEGRKYPKEIYKAAKGFLAFLKEQNILQVFAVADPAIEAAERFLLHFGFQSMDTSKDVVIYRWLAQTQ
jgi:hypothetical protein